MKFGSKTESGRASPLALAVLVALLVGLAAWGVSWHRPPRGSALETSRLAPVAPADTAVNDEAIIHALAMTGLDSIAFKSRWHDEVRGLDLAALDPAKREIFLRFANAERCTCGCGYTLAGCRASDMSCEVSGPHLEALLDSVRAGRIRSARGVRSRPGSGG